LLQLFIVNAREYNAVGKCTCSSTKFCNVFYPFYSIFFYMCISY